MVLCCSIEREVLRDTSFDLFNWYREELLQIEYEATISTSESYATAEYSGSELDAESIGTHLSSLSGTDPSMPSLREVTNSSVGSSEVSEHDPINDDLPSLKTCSDSSDSEFDGFALRRLRRLIVNLQKQPVEGCIRAYCRLIGKLR
jgi:hypothetical protein